MKNLFKVFGIIVFVAVIGFSMIACGDGGGSPHDPTTGSGQYAGKDVLGNNYSLSVGSDASRAAVRGDRYSMNVKTRDGKTRTSKGTVSKVNSDGTLTLKPDGSGDEFTATVGTSSLNSVAGVGGGIAQVGLDNGETITTRTFDNIYLRAGRWTNAPMRGENWGSYLSVLVKDFPANVSRLTQDATRYTITVSGTTDVKLDHAVIEVQGLTDDDEWVWFGKSDETVIPAGAFNKDFPLNTLADFNTVSANFMDYREVILQVTNVINLKNDNDPSQDQNYGTIPADIPDGQIMATISNFNIVLKDAQKEALAGNAGNYTYGFQEDGLSVAYEQAVFKLSAENIAKAKQTGAKFEFVMMDVDVDNINTTLGFIWQDPARELWWQDMSTISGGDENDNWAFKMWNGASWDPSRKKVTIDLSKVIKDNRFAAATELNFIIACWWNGVEHKINIDELGIAGANITVPSSSTGNMGGYTPGYQEDGISFEYNQAVWHLTETVFETAKTNGAKLEIVFNEDLETRTAGYPVLALIWQDIPTERWWPNPTEAGNENENLIIFKYELDKNGVTYNSTAKKLTVDLSEALETYSSFKTATDVNLILTCWYGITTNIDELGGIASANIVSD